MSVILADDLCGVQATADHFGVKMYIVTSYREGEIIEINPNGPLRSERVLYLSFWAEVILKALLSTCSCSLKLWCQLTH